MTIFAMQMDMEHQPCAHLHRCTHYTVLETSTKAKNVPLNGKQRFPTISPFACADIMKSASSDRLLKIMSNSSV